LPGRLISATLIFQETAAYVTVTHVGRLRASLNQNKLDRRTKGRNWYRVFKPGATLTIDLILALAAGAAAALVARFRQRHGRAA
jgi:hypothetical protein